MNIAFVLKCLNIYLQPGNEASFSSSPFRTYDIVLRSFVLDSFMYENLLCILRNLFVKPIIFLPCGSMQQAQSELEQAAAAAVNI